jgi:hypothetical protein
MSHAAAANHEKGIHQDQKYDYRQIVTSHCLTD